MTACARERATLCRGTVIDGLGYLLVTVTASRFRDFMVALRNAQRIGEVARCEVERVPETVTRLGHVLADQVMLGVAVVADGHGMVRRLGPGGIMLGHDVAVGAGGRIVGQIGCASRVYKGECTDPDRHTEQNDGRGY